MYKVVANEIYLELKMSKSKKGIFVIFAVILLLTLSACSALNQRLALGTEIADNPPQINTDSENPTENSTVDSESDAIESAIKLTSEAEETLLSESLTAEIQMTVESANLTANAEVATHTSTPEPIVDEPSPTATLEITVEPSIPPTPDGWEPSATPAECLVARYVSDISIPDGSVITPGGVFYKTWRVQNVGSCIWRPDFKIVYAGGFQLNAQTPLSIGINVYPDQYVNLTLRLVAPIQNGFYRGDFKLMDLDENVFGIGDNADKPFYFEISIIGGDQ